MKLTALLLLLGILHVSATALSQEISFRGKDVTLEKVFAEIKSQAGYHVVGNKDLLRNAKHVTLSVQKMPLKNFLDLLFKDQLIQYRIEEQTIMFSSKPALPVNYTVDLAIPIEVVGYLLKEDGSAPLSGATVTVKGLSKAVTADNYGKFTIKANPGDILVISYIGFITKEVPVKTVAMGVIYLKQSTSVLDETVIMAYGTTSRRYATGDIVRVTSEDIAKQPVTNVLQALQGRMPGVLINQTSGIAGAKVTVQVRGQNFVGSARNEALYVIDGVPFPAVATNRAISTGVTDGSYKEISPLNTINPSDIESIEVLKDADATAIYGSRGANGVILVTTKKGKIGRTSFNANVWTGSSRVANKMELLSTAEYVKLRQIAFTNDGITPTTTNAPDLLTWSQTATTDFQKLLIGNTAKNTDANVSVSGGDMRNRYLVSGTYHKETTVFPGDQGYSRAGILLNNDHTSANNKFNISTSVQYSSDKNNVSLTDPTGSAFALPPNFPLYNADGSLSWGANKSNPLAELLRSFDYKSTNLIGHGQVRYTIIPGLDVKASAGYNKLTTDQVRIAPGSSYLPSYNFKSSSQFTSYNTESYIIEPQVSYARQISEGRLNVLVGGTWQSTSNKMPYNITATDYTSEDFLSDPAAGATRTVTTAATQYKYASMFGRLTYNWQNKYIVNGTFRRDGSSRFGPGNRWGNFGSVGAAWLFTEEAFAKKLSWLSFGKLRGSYGLTGSDQISDFGYISLYTTSTTFGTASTLVPNLGSGLPNPNYHWEENRKLEAALDLGVFKDRILFSAAWFRNRSDNQLVNFSLSPQVGSTSYQANMPALVQNTGWEFTLTSVNIDKGKLRYTTALNITVAKNKLISYPDLKNSSFANTYVEGYSLNSAFLYKSTGIDPATGLQTFADVDKSGTVTSGISLNGKGDYVYAGDNYPDFYGGLNNSLSYKGIQLDIFVQFTKQMGRTVANYSYYPPGMMYNTSKELVNNYLGNNWENNPAITQSYAAAYSAYSRWAVSDANFVDASFIRLKNVSLSYSLPDALMKKWHLQKIRFYVQGQNLFTITGYKGYDPETKGVSLPPLRVLTAGIQLTL